jgi:hypothetical protein
MQTLTEFLDQKADAVNEDGLSIGKFYDDKPGARHYASLEPSLRAAVDAVCIEYASQGRVPPSSLGKPDLLYLFHLRLLEGVDFGQWLAGQGFEETHKRHDEWLIFLTVEAWREVLAVRWKARYLAHYGQGPTDQP